MFWSNRHEYQPVSTTTTDGTDSSSAEAGGDLGASGTPPSGSPTGSSGPAKAQQWVIALIGIIGGLALALTLAADVMRVKQSSRHLVDGQNDLHCIYPSSPSGSLAATATFLLVVAQGVALLHGGMTWCYASRLDTRRNRNLLLVVLATNLIFLAVTILALSVAAMDNSQPGIYTLRSSASSSSTAQNPDPCPVADSALFLSASLLCLFTVLLMEAYYLAAVRTRQYAWMVARYSTVRSVHLEAFQREAMRASVVPVGSPRSDLEAGEEIKEA